MANKLLSMVGLAKRAGKLQTGYDASVGTIKERTGYGILVASDISAKTEKNIRYEAERGGVTVVKIQETIDEISRAIGKKAGIVSFLDAGFFKAILNMTGGEQESAENQFTEKG
ncbi:MAG: ribosomal L7Ae/L30e/S12e/Gadd45 family protein [Oscillospiraceae bacterium]